ncbi:MAG: hypothetical protein V1910_00805 [bacterium]
MEKLEKEEETLKTHGETKIVSEKLEKSRGGEDKMTIEERIKKAKLPLPPEGREREILEKVCVMEESTWLKIDPPVTSREAKDIGNKYYPEIFIPFFDSSFDCFICLDPTTEAVFVGGCAEEPIYCDTIEEVLDNLPFETEEGDEEKIKKGINKILEQMGF